MAPPAAPLALPPTPEKDPAAVALGRRGGLARAQRLTPAELSAIGRAGANARRRRKAREAKAS